MIIILDRWWKYRDGERIIIENYNERIKSFSLTYHIYISDDCFQLLNKEKKEIKRKKKGESSKNSSISLY